MEELQKNYRKNIIDVLQLLSSKKAQLDYQKNVPIAQVSSELINSWGDTFQVAKDSGFLIEIFSENEIKALSLFDSVIEDIIQKLPEILPEINDFVETEEWKILSEGAIVALSKVSTSD